MGEVVGADFYNYDYKVMGGNKTYLNANEVRIRGRKFYWHSDTQKKADLAKDSPNQTITARSVQKNKSFNFDVAFENLTPQELSNLIWVLTIGGKDNHAHKLGHGKPIGYGSVQIKIDEGGVVLYGLDENFTIQPMNKPIDLPAPAFQNVEAFELVTNWEQKPKNVSYPNATINGKSTIFNWFVSNREIPPAKSFMQAFKNLLPDIDDNNQELPMYEKQGRDYIEQYSSNRKRAQAGSVLRTASHNNNSGGLRPLSSQPKPPENKTNFVSGKCRECGELTKINQKTGKYYEFCYLHSPYMKKKK
jgi:hypothetical protein